MKYIEKAKNFTRLFIGLPLLFISMIVSNRGPFCGPDIKGRDNRAFKWIPWGK